MLSVILPQGCSHGPTPGDVSPGCAEPVRVLLCAACCAVPSAPGIPKAVFALAVSQVQEEKLLMIALPLKYQFSAAFLIRTLKRLCNSPSCADGQSSHTYG